MAGRGEAAGVREGAPARATERELVVVAAVLEAGSEKAAAHRLGLSHSTVKHHLASARSKVGATTTAQLVWILGPRLPEPESTDLPGESDACCAVLRPDCPDGHVSRAETRRMPVDDVARGIEGEQVARRAASVRG